MALSSSSIPILGLLTWRPMAGYELRQKIQESIGNFWSESYGQIYPQLRLLNEAGLITKVLNEQSKRENKNVYAITDTGREALSEWISNTPVNRPPRNELLLKVFFASEGDQGVVLDHCRKAREDAVERLRKYRSIEKQLKTIRNHQGRLKYWQMTLRMGISEAQNFISWCDETLSEFQKADTHDEDSEK
ncbi:MAG: PadR family transcriptional regulator [Rhizobiales bacterium]|nr:PadR family transcriptional regulator [Hyphomicrobiales bacterium]